MPVFPKIFRVRQSFEGPRLEDVAGAVDAELRRLHLDRTVRPGHSVAVTAGSRGIAHIVAILRAVVRHLGNLGARPFLVPAMGNHGGGTAEGQRRLLESYGITEPAVGCPIRSSVETIVVCRAAEGFPVHFDRHAMEADHVLVCNRIRPHTSFAGPIESGLMKMLLVGLGKGEGAAIYHRAIQDYSFEQIVRSVAGEVLKRCNILAGLAILENAYDETALVEGVAPADFERREVELLLLARQWMPRLPFGRVDVLLIDQIGKNFSGIGVDSNVVGRKFDEHKAVEDEYPKVKRIALRGLSPQSHGNAIGIGIVEFCRSRLLRDADMAATRLNVLTSGRIAAAMCPLDYETDRQMLEAALGTIGLVQPQDARLLWIPNTLRLAEVECSAAYLDEARGRSDLAILTRPRPLPLDAAGNLPEWEDWLTA
jgi:hypothetical protein